MDLEWIIQPRHRGSQQSAAPDANPARRQAASPAPFTVINHRVDDPLGVMGRVLGMLTLLKAAAAFVAAAATTALPLAHIANHHQLPHSPAARTAAALPTGSDADLAVDQILALAPPPEPPVVVAPAAEAPADPAPAADPAPPDPAPAPAYQAPVYQAPAPPPPPVYRAPAPPPPAAVSIGSAQQAMINGDRAGLAPLNWNGCLAAIAAQNAARMAAAGAISHGNGVYAAQGCGLGGQTGENVGSWSGGINDGAINQLFMGSSGHYANIVGPYRAVGTAWAIGGNGVAYIAVEFG